MAEFWIDPLNGDNTGNDGSTPFKHTGSNGPLQTIQAGVAAAALAGPGLHTVSLMEGEYIDQTVSTLVRNLKIRGLGHVIVRSTIFGAGQSFFNFTEDPLAGAGKIEPGANITWIFEDLIFKNFLSVVKIQLNGSTAGLTGEINLYTENSTYMKSPGSPAFLSQSSIVHVDHDASSSNTPPAASTFFHYRAQNNTVYRLDRIYRVTATGAVTGTLELDVDWEKNNLYYTNDPASDYLEVPNTTDTSGPAAIVVRSASNSDYNAVPDFNITGPGQVGGLHEITSNTTTAIFKQPGTEPVNLALQRSFGGVPVGPDGAGMAFGEFGDMIGSSFWPIAAVHDLHPTPANGFRVQKFHNRSKALPTGTTGFENDWEDDVSSLWVNDPNWFDTGLVLAGAEAIAASESTTASPVLLTTDADPRWIIDASMGGAAVAKVLSPIFDAGKRVSYQGIDFWGQQNTANPGGSKEVLDADNSFTINREVEVRAANNIADFTTGQTTSTTDLAWAMTTRFVNTAPAPYSSIPYRYWQVRVTLRSNSTN